MNADSLRWGRIGRHLVRVIGFRVLVLSAFLCVPLRIQLPAAFAAPAPAPKPTIIRYEVQIGMPNKPVQKQDQTIWMKGKRFRVEMTMPPAGKQIVIGGPDGVYLLVTGMKEAMKLPQQAATQMGPSSITPDLAKLRQQKKVGSEKVGRYKTDIYEQHADIQMPGQTSKVKSTTRIWISRDVPVPVKTVSTLPGGFRTISLLKSAKVNVPIADSLFTLPKGTKVHTPGK